MAHSLALSHAPFQTNKEKMKKLYTFILLLCLQVVAENDLIIIEKRCVEDHLDPPQALLRNKWARKCYPDLIEEIDLYERKKRPLYALVQHVNGSWHGPTNPNDSCDGWIRKAFCLASCYPADQLVWFQQGYVPINVAVEAKLDNVMTLTKNSTIDEPKFQVLPIKGYSRSIWDSNETILTFKTASGRQMRVTTNHPILTADGVMRQASQIQVGQQLVKQNGMPDEIIEINSTLEFGKVFNLSPNSGNPIENIVVSQGLLTGSEHYQYLEEFNSLYGRKLLRRMVDLDPQKKQ